MQNLRVRLWQRELVRRLAEAGYRDEPDLWDWATELHAEEDAVQSEYRAIGSVFGQLSQVEAGVRGLTEFLEVKHPTTMRSQDLRFAQCIDLLRSELQPRFADELKALDRVRHLRNHIAHGEVRVGMARQFSESEFEPVIALMHSSNELPKSVAANDPVREVIEGDLQPIAAMGIASAGLEALLTIMIQIEFDPYARN